MKVNKEKLVKIIDFWHQSLLADDLFGRELIDHIDYKNKEIVDVVGPRRSGKSSLLKLIINRLGIADNFLYINFEDPFFINNNEAEIIEQLIETRRDYFGGKLKYLFFDEIQEIKNWEKAVRKLRDGASYKIFITGSSSSLLSAELSSLLTGRHSTAKMLPLSFREFLFFKKIDVDSPRDIILKQNLIKKKFKEYADLGGFPEIALTGNKPLLKDYFHDFLQKDIVVRHQVRDQDALEKMAVFFMSNSGKIFSIASIKKAFGLSYKAANNYFQYLKDAFLVFELRQFSFSLKKQSKTLSKAYAVDVGLAREASFSFSEDKGRILENIVFLHLVEKFENIYYYKTKNNLEVDFLVREKNVSKQLIQVCLSLDDEKTKKREISALLKAMKETGIKKGLIITDNDEYEIKEKNQKISVMPAWKWLLGT